MIEFESPEEARLWNKLCEDPLYPCAKCTVCQNPPQCHTKNAACGGIGGRSGSCRQKK